MRSCEPWASKRTSSTHAEGGGIPRFDVAYSKPTSTGVPCAASPFGWVTDRLPLMPRTSDGIKLMAQPPSRTASRSARFIMSCSTPAPFTLAAERVQPSLMKYSRPRRPTASVQRVAEVAPTTDGTPRPVVVVAALVTGEGADEALGRYDGLPVHLPADRDLWPAPASLKWHAREVFRSPDSTEQLLHSR